MAAPFPAPSPARPSPGEALTYALVGNPNCGKTSVFNGLTGLRQKVGNYPGVTVERKEGTCTSQHGRTIRVLDLPGAYSLSPRSPDEAILRDVLAGRRLDTPAPARVVVVVDAGNLERNLFLATQVLELGRPALVVLNMVDEAAAKGMQVDAEALARELGVPVVATEAHKGQGLLAAKLAMSRADLPVSAWECPPPEEARAIEQEYVRRLEAEGWDPSAARGAARAWLLSGGPGAEESAGSAEGLRSDSPATHRWATEALAGLDRERADWRGRWVAERYRRIEAIVAKVVRTGLQRRPDLTRTLDAVLLHPVAGWGFLGAVLAMLFFSVFSLAEAPMGWIEAGTGFASVAIGSLLPEGALRDLLVDGVVAGVGGVLVFLPQILLLFLFIGLLESTGYLSRAAFLLDRLMSRVGLHGRSFIPLLSSYACAIPGIMAARTIDSPRDRLVTILVAPFMSCSARLPVYFVMIAALMPAGQASAVGKAGLLLFLYALGTFGAFFFAWLFKRTVFKGASTGLVMELPPYRVPLLRHVLREMLDRAVVFVRRAGTVILGLSVVLWFLMSYPKPAEEAVAPAGDVAGAVAASGEASALEQTFAGRFGKVIEPVLAPLGYDWRTGIAVVASFAAREVFVSTLAIAYRVEGDLEGDDGEQALVSVLREQRREDGSVLFTPRTCLSLMVFYVFALQCLSTIAVVRRETNSWRWPPIMLVMMTGTAYLSALAVFQVGGWLGLP